MAISGFRNLQISTVASVLALLQSGACQLCLLVHNPNELVCYITYKPLAGAKRRERGNDPQEL